MLHGDIHQLLGRVAAVAGAGWNDQGVGTSLWGLQRMGAVWDDLPVAARSAVCTAVCRECFRMSAQAAGNTVYSLGTLPPPPHI